MSSALASTSRLAPSRRGAPTPRRGESTLVRVVRNKKALSFDESWKKGFWGTGLFVEGKEARGTNYLESIERKGVLSAVERAGLLSTAEKAGVTLSAIEKAGLLSTAERLGLLEAAENALVTDPGRITAASIAPLVATLGVLALFPDDSALLALLKYAVAAVTGGAFLALFAGGFVVASLQE